MTDPALRIIDADAGGDVSRVIIAGAPELRGATVAAKCADFARRYDHLRWKLIQPPHGALHMCPVLLLPGAGGEADFGVIIMESMGYPPISGSNLFCATLVALEHGYATWRQKDTVLKVDTPAGIVPITAHRDGPGRGRFEFENTPARLLRSGTVTIDKPRATVEVAVVSAGVDYAVVAASSLGIALTTGHEPLLIELGTQIAAASRTEFVLFHGDLQHTRNESRCDLAVFQNPGVICRSPTGTGTSALLVLACERGLIRPDGRLSARSPLGNVFTGRILALDDEPSPPRIRTAVSGHARVLAALTIE